MGIIIIIITILWISLTTKLCHSTHLNLCINLKSNWNSIYFNYVPLNAFEQWRESCIFQCASLYYYYNSQILNKKGKQYLTINANASSTVTNKYTRKLNVYFIVSYFSLTKFLNAWQNLKRNLFKIWDKIFSKFEVKTF